MSNSPVSFDIDRTVTPSPVYVYRKTADATTKVKIGAFGADGSWIPVIVGDVISGIEAGIASLQDSVASISQSVGDLQSKLAASSFTLPPDVVLSVNGIPGPHPRLHPNDMDLGGYSRIAYAPFLLDFTQGAFPSAASITGGDNGIFRNAAGVYTTGPAPRLDYLNGVSQGILIERAATNLERNNSLVGAATGDIAAGGALPTNWQVLAPGLTCNVTSFGVVNGEPKITLRLTGTVTSTAISIYRETTTGIDVSPGDNLAQALTVARTANGSLAGITSSRLIVDEYNADGTTRQAINSGTTPGGVSPPALSTTPFRYVGLFTMGASAAKARSQFRMACTNGAAIDVELTLSLGQTEKLPSAAFTATSPILTAGAAVTRAADALSFTVPTGVSLIYAKFSDLSQQGFFTIPGPYTVDPMALSQPRITSLAGQLILPALQV